MRKDFINRLEKALKSLEFSSGASLGSLVTEINKESPHLSLKKILEELQNGVDEGTITMDEDGKLKVLPKSERAIGDCNTCEDDLDGCSLIGNYSDGNVSIGDGKNVKNLETLAVFKERKVKKIVSMNRKMKGKHRGDGQRAEMAGTRLEKKCASQNEVDRESDASDVDDEMRGKTGKVEHKRRRGPRCTSMRKEVKMPSRVHIPWTPKPVPQRDLMHNDLLRKSPDPMIGPLFDPLQQQRDDMVACAIDLPFS